MAKRKPPLTVEELRKLPWKDYIKTPHWRKFSKSILDDEDCVCEICGKNRWNGVYIRGKKKGKRKRTCQFHIHHKNYNHLGEENRSDVLSLCAPCHKTVHDIEMLSRTRQGIWEKIYSIIKEFTLWEYTSFKDKDK